MLCRNARTRQELSLTDFVSLFLVIDPLARFKNGDGGTQRQHSIVKREYEKYESRAIFCASSERCDLFTADGVKKVGGDNESRKLRSRSTRAPLENNCGLTESSLPLEPCLQNLYIHMEKWSI